MQKNHAFTTNSVTILFLFVTGISSTMFTGCKNDGLHAVSGTVLLDGTPLAEGTIAFMPSGENGVSAGASIKDGTYSARISPGKMIVKIYSERHLTPEEVNEYNTNPMTKGSLTPAEAVIKQVIPAIYNERSNLTVEIQEGRKDLNFQLESQ